jgi:hypothetical protein
VRGYRKIFTMLRSRKPRKRKLSLERARASKGVRVCEANLARGVFRAAQTSKEGLRADVGRRKASSRAQVLGRDCAVCGLARGRGSPGSQRRPRKWSAIAMRVSKRLRDLGPRKWFELLAKLDGNCVVQREPRRMFNLARAGLERDRRERGEESEEVCDVARISKEICVRSANPKKGSWCQGRPRKGLVRSNASSRIRDGA